jgi:hypothetical protein
MFLILRGIDRAFPIKGTLEPIARLRKMRIQTHEKEISNKMRFVPIQ